MQTIHTADCHIARRRKILAAHPEVRDLYGPNRWSFALVIALVAAQFGMAFLLREQSLLVILLIAWLAGAYLAGSLFALIHEASHTLIFKRKAANRIAALLANLPLVNWSAMPFFRYHIAHHAAFGDYARDVGVPTHAEIEWVGNSAWRKALRLAAFPLFQALRVAKFPPQKRYWDAWMIANATLQITALVLVLHFFGWRSLLYLALCISFALGLHPLGTRVVQEHFVLAEGQETNDFTGWANCLECNFGYHQEHHDFMHVPWNRLPALRRIAREHYEDLPAFRSRLRLMIEFIFNPNWSLARNFQREAAADAGAE